MTAVLEKKEAYVAGYKALQANWKKKDKELLLAGKLSYWIYWLSKYAEAATDASEKGTFFQLKSNGLQLLQKSEYVQIRKYIPEHHKRICYYHYEVMKKEQLNPHYFLHTRRKEIHKCRNCQTCGTPHFFSLYSIALLTDNEDTEDRKPIFIFYAPYTLYKEQFPALDVLEPVKFYRGKEVTSIGPEQFAVEVELDTYSKETVFRYFTKNYQELSQYFANKEA